MGDWEQATELELLLQRLSAERTEPRGHRLYCASSSFDAQSQPFNPSQIYQDPDTHDDDDLDEHDRALLEEPYPDRAFEAAQGRGRLSLPPAGQISFPDNAYSPTQSGPSRFDEALRNQHETRATPLAKQTQRIRRPLQDIPATRTPIRTIETQSSSPFFAQSSPTPVRPRRQESIRRSQQTLSSPQRRPAQTTAQYPPRGPSVRPLQRQQIAPPEDVENYPPPRPMPPLFSQPVVRGRTLPQPQNGMQGPTVHGIPLVPVCELPDSFASVFPYALFNAVQSKCYNQLINTDDNFVMSAPTGSGKTVILELAITRLILTLRPDQFKAVYMAPTRALCSEKYRDWSEKFRGHNLGCVELTGDTATNDTVHSIQTANIIITTPEKWDSTTRKWREHKDFMALIKALLIDEVHMLKDIRGATLEAVVARMKTIGAGVRFVALSATVPNASDIAQWLGRSPDEPDVRACMETFGEDYRPVKLEKYVKGFGHSNAPTNDFQLEEMFNASLPSILSNYSQKFPILVFCPTRASCSKTAKLLAEKRASDQRGRHWWSLPSQPLASANSELQITLVQGVAFHHGGLSADERRKIETGFANRDIKVICCTSTLAVGVNTPCHLAIIKGTKGWTDTGFREYSDLDMMQMMGRAGRPQYGHQGAVTVIMTSLQNVSQYNRLVSGQEPLESCLHFNLIEHLNAEISLGTITNVETAKAWLKGSFLYIRLKKNASNYKVDSDNAAQMADADSRVNEVCRRELAALTSTRLATNDGALKSTEFGEAMTRYCVRFKTMQLLINLPERAKMSDVLSSLVSAEEFKEINLQRAENSLYQNLNTLPGIRFPLGTVKTSSDKCSLVVQAELGGVELPKNTSKPVQTRYGLAKAAIFKEIHRLVRCVVDCKVSLLDAEAVRHTLVLARSLSARAWDDWPEQLKQISDIGPVRVRKLVGLDIKSIADLAEADAARINMKLNSKTCGEKWITTARLFPRPTITISKADAPDIGSEGIVTLKVKVEIDFLNDRPPITFQHRPVFLCVMVERSDGHLLDFRKVKSQRPIEPIMTEAQLTAYGQKIVCRVMCDDFAGTSQAAELDPELPQRLFPIDTTRTEKSAMNELRKLSTKRSVPQSSRPKAIVGDSFDDLSDLDDADLLAVEEQTGFRRLEDMVGTKRNAKRTKSIQQPKKDSEPRRRPDGRFDCNHHCKDKSACKHECCKKGLEKPPKPPRPSKIDQPVEEIPKQRKLHQLTINKSQFKSEAINNAAGLIDSDDDLDTSAEVRPSKRQRLNAGSFLSRPDDNAEIVDPHSRAHEDVIVRSPPQAHQRGSFSVTALDPIDEFDEVDLLPTLDTMFSETGSALPRDTKSLGSEPERCKGRFSADLTDTIDEFDEVDLLPESNVVLNSTLPATPAIAKRFGMTFSSDFSTDFDQREDFSTARVDRHIPPMPTTDDATYDADDHVDPNQCFSQAMAEGPFGSLRPGFIGGEDMRSGTEVNAGPASPICHLTTTLDGGRSQADAMEVSWPEAGAFTLRHGQNTDGIDDEILKEYGGMLAKDC